MHKNKIENNESDSLTSWHEITSQVNMQLESFKMLFSSSTPGIYMDDFEEPCYVPKEIFELNIF